MIRPIKTLVTILLAAAILAVPAAADEPPEILTGARPTAKPEILDIEIHVPKGSIEATLADPAAGFDNIVFDIWKVSDIEGNLTADFQKSAVSIDVNDSSAWLDDAAALEAYARAEKIKPAASPATDTTGAFKQTGLEMGIYLIAAQDFVRNDTKYELQAFLAPIPCMGSFEISAAVKAKASPVPPKETVIRTVIKTWKNDNKRVRPESITVELLKDGKPVETVALSEKNNWKHTWTGLPAENTWTVREKDVPKNYSVRIHKEGITFQIVNTYRKNYEPVTPERPNMPTPGRPYDPTPWPENPGTAPTPNTPPGLVDIDENPVPTGPLPQAGANWIPVILLSLAGFFSLGLTLAAGRKQTKD